MKKELVKFSFFIFLLNFVSAYGYSIGNSLDQFGGENLAIIIIFFASFALLNWLLSRSIKNNKAVTAILSLCSAVLISYGAYRSGVTSSMENLFSGFYFSNPFSNFYFSNFYFSDFFNFSSGTNDILFTVIPILLLGLFIFLLFKIKEYTLLLFGGILILLALVTEIFYEKEKILIIGGVMVVLGILWYISRRFVRSRTSSANLSPSSIEFRGLLIFAVIVAVAVGFLFLTQTYLDWTTAGVIVIALLAFWILIRQREGKAKGTMIGLAIILVGAGFLFLSQEYLDWISWSVIIVALLAFWILIRQ